MFAFGSALYEMVTGRPPYEDKSDSEVERLFLAREFLRICDTKILGSVITRCWNVDFSSMHEISKSIEDHEGMRTLVTCYKCILDSARSIDHTISSQFSLAVSCPTRSDNHCFRCQAPVSASPTHLVRAKDCSARDPSNPTCKRRRFSLVDLFQIGNAQPCRQSSASSIYLTVLSS
jgi:hypothetical protein